MRRQPRRTFDGGKTFLSRRAGLGGLRFRHAMTTLSVLTIGMATFMIIMATTTTSSKGSASKQNHPDDFSSPLAQALSSSRRRNLSQLLPEEETLKRKDESVEEASRKKKNVGKVNDAAQIPNKLETTTPGGTSKEKNNGVEDDGQKIRAQLRKLEQKKEEAGPAGVQKGTESGQRHLNKEKAGDNSTKKVVETKPIVATKGAATKGAATKGAGSTPDVQVVVNIKNESRNEQPKKHLQVNIKNVSGNEQSRNQLHVIVDDARRMNVTTNTTNSNFSDVDKTGHDNVIKGFGTMLHHLPIVNLTVSSGETSSIATPFLGYQERIQGRNPYAVPDARGQMMNVMEQLENRVGGEQVPDTSNPVDPLWNNVSSLNLTSLDIRPKVPYLGVLVDAGRHYFPIVWLKNMMLYLHAMNFNFIHFRLTDDQTFNINLTSYPQLASPVSYNNPDHLVYSKEELRDLVQYAERLNITIMPEINVPGHAGSWAGVPGLVVNCPEFVCEKGYGIPINVTHPDLPKILTSILQEVREVFYTSPFLHLGGDEVHMAMPCFNELGANLFDYGPFENMLKGVLRDLNISNDKVLRWEMTGQQIEGRAGKMIHFWESDPGNRINTTGPYFISNGLYFDSNGRDRAFDIYQKTHKQLHLSWTPYLQAIVAGTFELNPDFWFQRNVIGRLIAVAMGASGRDYNDFNNFTVDYYKYCEQLQIDKKVCKFEGVPILEQHEYYANWQGAWAVWKRGTCERLTYPEQVRAMLPVYNWREQMLEQVNREFWASFAREPRVDGNGTVMRGRIKPSLPYEFKKVNVPAKVAPIRRHAVNHTGVILDLVNAHPMLRQLEEIIDQLTILGFNLIQLQLADDFGYAMSIPISQGNRLEFRRGSHGMPIAYDHQSLARIVDYAERQGAIEVMPEISVSTDVGGWYKVGFGLPCPTIICNQGRNVANDITDPELLPVVSSIIRDLRKIFSSDFMHLGADEREQSIACFNESGKRTTFNSFERKLNTLLDLEGVDPKKVLRWENQERKRYRGRAGKITHFRVLQNASRVRRPDKGESFFANIDIFEGDAWNIYQKSRALVNMKPLGLMAEVRLLLAWSDRNTFGRLLAFAMGVSTLPEWFNQTQFRGNFTEYCQAIVGAVPSIEQVDCKWFEHDKHSWEVEVETEASRQQSCNGLTFITTKRIARTNITAY